MTEKKLIKRRLFIANFSTVLSIALVLFMVASIFLSSFHAWYFSNQIKEEVAFTIYMADTATLADGQALTKEIQANPMVKSCKYVSQEDATLMMDSILGDGHLDVLEGYNPYQASIEVHLKSDNFSVEQIKQFIRTYESRASVDMVDYRDDLINDINTDFYNASVFFIVILTALLIICITLINHTINLTISSKKMLIRSMQLIGAKSSFIRRPFLFKGLWLGAVGGIVAVIFVAAVMFWIYSLLGGFDVENFLYVYIFVGSSVVVLGILLTLLFSYIAVMRNMNLKNYKLYN